jgi:hypothetical protein
MASNESPIGHGTDNDTQGLLAAEEVLLATVDAAG